MLRLSIRMGLRAWGLESSRCSLISCLLFVLSFGSCVFVCVSASCTSKCLRPGRTGFDFTVSV